ncbi:mechanosensitive ion channel family protein [Aquimarina agarivorans]|uniref:mechanosensitive ion channel family protein n=1 Tax=Aquimarina agarivorans TaxID=980584 RepID=UPI000248FB5F|nr:mechanosensitive ion channel domain-containing protein [Aquimarina agarivorans]
MEFSQAAIESLKIIGIGLVISIILYHTILYTLKLIGKNPKYVLPLNFQKRIKAPLLLLFFFLFALYTKIYGIDLNDKQNEILSKIIRVGFIISTTWIVLNSFKFIIRKIISKYDTDAEDNLKARKIYTQFKILERVISFVVILLAIGILLMSFENIRQIGISLLTSAGIAGIIIGFAAQKALSTLLAGIQIAFTQPIRMDDVVIVENEWGVIEEINLTYVVVKIWDKRRLVVPTTYFIEKPFQNWTRNSADILGTIFIYTDYKVPTAALRKAQTEILNNTSLWDKQVDIIQVTNAQKDIIELRSLVSAKDSPTAWDLRVHVREKLIDFLQQNYPESLPHSSIKIKENTIKTEV